MCDKKDSCIFGVSMNTTPVITENGFNWFAEQEIAWGCIHYVSSAYLVPLNCVIGLCENLAILFVFSHMKTGVGESARLYYSLLAVFNLLNLLVFHGIDGFITVGLHFATHGTFYFSGPLYNIWLCKICINAYFPLSVLVMWTYVLLNVERVFAIASPLRAKIIFTPRRNLMYIFGMGVLGVVLMIYSMSLQEISYTFSVIGPLACLPDSPSLANIIFFQVFSNLAIFTFPPALTLFLGVVLFIFIRRQLAARAHLLKGTSRSSDAPNSSAITGGVVVVIMALVHSLINLPAGVFGCLFFMYAQFISAISI